jgi:ABC-type oligopeptide transport system ATPase subunit
VSFSIEKSKTLGLVGESGCGKSTLAKTILNLYKKDYGQILFEGKNLSFNKLSERQKIQIVFQDPFASLDPKMTILEILSEPYLIHTKFSKKQIIQEITQLLKELSLPTNIIYQMPHEFSGGQRQRIAIARALTLKPKFLILDEPVSALDVSVQAQILNLLVELQTKYQLTYLFIAHDLAVVKYMSDEIAVMKDGEIVETQKADSLFKHPKHPYTKKLLSSMLFLN